MGLDGAGDLLASQDDGNEYVVIVNPPVAEDGVETVVMKKVDLNDLDRDWAPIPLTSYKYHLKVKPNPADVDILRAPPPPPLTNGHFVEIERPKKRRRKRKWSSGESLEEATSQRREEVERVFNLFGGNNNNRHRRRPRGGGGRQPNQPGPVINKRPQSGYSSPQAPVISAGDDYSSPQAPVISTGSDYSAPQAPVISTTGDYSSPQAPVVSNASPQYQTPATQSYNPPSDDYSSPQAPVVTNASPQYQTAPSTQSYNPPPVVQSKPQYQQQQQQQQKRPRRPGRGRGRRPISGKFVSSLQSSMREFMSDARGTVNQMGKTMGRIAQRVRSGLSFGGGGGGSSSYGRPQRPKLPRPQLPDIKLPQIKIPRPSLPTIQIPEFDLPDIKLPRPQLPQLHLPRPQLPQINLPRPQLPDIHLPRPQLPQIKIPRPQLPHLNLPRPQLPDIKIPQIKIPRPNFQNLIPKRPQQNQRPQYQPNNQQQKPSYQPQQRQEQQQFRPSQPVQQSPSSYGTQGLANLVTSNPFLRPQRNTSPEAQKEKDMKRVKDAYQNYQNAMREYEEKYNEDDPDLNRFKKEILAQQSSGLSSSLKGNAVGFGLTTPKLVEDLTRRKRQKKHRPHHQHHRPQNKKDSNVNNLNIVHIDSATIAPTLLNTGKTPNPFTLKGTGKPKTNKQEINPWKPVQNSSDERKKQPGTLQSLLESSSKDGPEGQIGPGYSFNSYPKKVEVRSKRKQDPGNAAEEKSRRPNSRRDSNEDLGEDPFDLGSLASTTDVDLKKYEKILTPLLFSGDVKLHPGAKHGGSTRRR